MPIVRFVVALAVVAAALGVPSAGAATPLVLSSSNDASRALTWSGVAEAHPAGVPVAAPGTEPTSFVARLGSARHARATIWVRWATSDDLVLRVEDGRRVLLASSDQPAGTDEVVSFTIANGATYTVRVLSKSGASSTTQTGYTVAAWVKRLSGTNTGESKHLRYEKPNACGDAVRKDAKGKRLPPVPCYYSLKVPISIVFVGFDEAEVDAHIPDLMASLPPTGPRAPRPKPVVLDESATGGAGLLAREGGSQVREAVLVQGTSISHLPFSYEYSYHVVVANERYSRSLFAAAKAATTPGEHVNPADRAYLQSYNARAAAFRRDHPVLPNAPVDFVDATKLEDWIARNPPKGLQYDLAKPSTGYTYFVLDTYRPRYAGEYFDLSRYHNFRVMNATTRDPDSGAQLGFDWGRVWGGRYRFLMLDTGAAPNSFEGSTQRRAATYRTAFDGDSALLDPPVWEYAGCVEPVDCRDLIPQFYRRLGENVLAATFMRFTRSYGSRPTAADRYIVASHTWTDASATTAASAQSRRYDANLVVQRLRELLPAARVDAFARERTLRAGDAEQHALDAARGEGFARQPSATTASTAPVQRLIDSKRGNYAPEGGTTTSIPVVNAVHPGLTQWRDAGIDGSVLATAGRDPWGLFNGINAATDAAGASGFTAATLRNVGRVLGLLPATEGVVYAAELPGDLSNPLPHPADPLEQQRAYYHTVDWTHATTATPMSSGFFYGRFEVLDRDAIANAHAVDWLDRSLDDVSDAFAALEARGYRAITPAVNKQIVSAGKYIGESVAGTFLGFHREAVVKARRAKSEMEKAVTTAIRTARARR